MLIPFFSIFLLILKIGNLSAQNQNIPETLSSEKKNINTTKKYYDDSKRGWYWYEDPPPKEKDEQKKEEKKEIKEAKKIPSLEDYTTDQLWNMHPDEFSKLLNEIHKKAVQYPTEENMYEYLLIQDIARRKSLAVANVQMAMTQKYPEFDVGKDYPLATPGRNVYIQQTTGEIENKIQNSRDDFGLIFFYSPACKYCHEQAKINQFFYDKYKWEIKNVDITKNNNVSRIFNIETVPYIILVYKYNSQDYIPITAGVSSLDEMESKIFRGIKLLAKEDTIENYSKYNFQKGTTQDTTIYQETKKIKIPKKK